MHEVKYAHIQNVQQRDMEQDSQNIFHQAENDIIDSYTALRATQRESQLVRSSMSPSQMKESATMLSGEDPYKLRLDPAYLESRYSVDTANNNERVIRGSRAIAADQTAPRQPRQTDSTQTCWEDVIGYGSSSRNPYTATEGSLAGIPERDSGHSDLQSERGSVHRTVRGGVPPLMSDFQRQNSVKSLSGAASGPGINNSVDMFDYKKYASSRTSDAASLVSSLQSMELRDRHDRRSAVSSLSSHEGHRHHQQGSRQSYRNSRDSAWTDASVPVVLDARLSRPFDQPTCDPVTVRDRSSRYERRR